MMDDNIPVLEGIDPELVKRAISERDSLSKAAAMVGVIATAPVAFTALSSVAFGASLPQQIVDVLNFALTLEYLEDEFYRTAVSSPNLIPGETRAVFGQISKHETAHVALLKKVLGKSAGPKPAFDFTAGGMFGDVFSNYQTFLALSQAFEDTGVRAYKGQAGNLKSNAKILTTALQIHSVEARHAAEVRFIRGQKGWITGESRGDLPEATQPIYAGEGGLNQGGADLQTLPGFVQTAATEAFDEPLTKEQVLAIVRPFLRA